MKGNMTIQSLRTEIKWTRILLGCLFIGIFFMDNLIHKDYEDFLDTKERIKYLEINQMLDESNADFYLELYGIDLTYARLIEASRIITPDKIVNY